MEKKTLQAVILSILVLLAYQGFMAKFYGGKDKLKTETAPSFAVSGSERQAQVEPLEPELQLEALPGRENLLKAREEIISSEGVSAYFSSQDGVIKKILLEEEDGEFFLIEQEDTKYAPLALWFDSYPREFTALNYKGYAKDNALDFSANISKDVDVKKEVRFGKSNYGIELELIFSNSSSQDKKAGYLVVAASNIDQSNVMDKRFSGIQSKVDGIVVWENQRALKSAADRWVEHRGVTDWVALRNVHYEVVLKPEKPTSASVARYLDKNSFACGLKIDNFVIPANSSVSHKYLLYTGPTSYKYLSAYNLEDTIYFGKLNVICKFLLKSLRFFYAITHNYGLAILILTLSICVVLSPLTKKNFRSMRQMQIIQPAISKLREAHKGNPQKLQREMMGLYKKHNVNPLGGCLPMFLQMPIFISLYLTLVRSVELKGANFLWIKDLSAPDAVCALPFKMPILGNQLNLLPILMMVAMVVQQKLSSYKRAKSDPQTEQQQKMMLMMPLVFGIIFYSLPSGLVLYWVTNTIFMTLVQFHIAKAMPSVEMITG